MKKSKDNPPVSLPRLKDWHALVIISALVAVYFHEILLMKSFFWEDFLYQFYPFRNFAAAAIAGGELPLWNPYTFSGTPFQADIQSALFYVPNLLLSLFVSGGKLHFYWVELFIILHYVLAGVTMYYYAREIGITAWGALLSGIIFTFSGFMVTHAIHQVVICQVAWLPLILLLFRRALMRRSLIYCILTGLTLGHAVLAGFPQISLYIFFFLFLYFIYEFLISVKEKGLKNSLALPPIAAGAIIIAVALTALQLLPTMELAPLSQRAEITYEKSLEGSLSWEQLITFVVPHYFGSSGAQGSTYWGPGAYWVFWETCFYLGIPAAVLIGFALAGIRRNHMILFLSATGLFGLLYALGDGFIFHKFFYSFVPGFETFRSIGRMTLYTTVAGALLGGFGLDRIIELVKVNNTVLRRGALIAACAGILLWFLAQTGSFQPDGSGHAAAQVHRSAVTAMILFLVCAAIIYLLYRRNITLVFGIVTFLIIQFADLYIFGFDQNNSKINPDEYYGRTANIVDFLKKEGGKEYFRVNSRQGGAMILDRNQGMIDRIFLMEGYTPLSLKRNFPPAKNWDGVCDLLNAKYRISINQQQRQMSLAASDTYLPRAFLVYGVKVISDEKKLQEYMESGEFDPRSTVLLEEEPVFIPSMPSESASEEIKITSYHLNKIELETATSHDGYLVLSEVYYPGWEAYIDGTREKIYRADWNLRAVPLRSGNHKIEMKFDPASFITGFWITAATIGLSACGIVYSQRRKKNVSQQKGRPT